ncbi:hypothetical protein KY331_02285 [Candidatus Woesearchaeota archaeon]|nr:hypothetical protein [Candidatus Woesearchaeota archaeon]
MAWLFKKRSSAIGINKLHNFLSLAFQKVKQDMNHTFRWLQYFHHKHNETDARLSRIEEHLKYIPNTHEEIKRIVDNSYSYGPVLQRIEDLHKRIDAIEQQKTERKAPLKERLMKKISKNSKNYVKSVIFSFIKKYEKISGPQLKEIIVEEQGLCSKSSFYRLLAELEQDEEIDTIESNKEKTYLPKVHIVK